MVYKSPLYADRNFDGMLIHNRGTGQQNSAPTWFHTCSNIPQCEHAI